MDNSCSGREKLLFFTVENHVGQFYKENTVPQTFSCATSGMMLNECGETVVTSINSKEMSMETIYF